MSTADAGAVDGMHVAAVAAAHGAVAGRGSGAAQHPTQGFAPTMRHAKSEDFSSTRIWIADTCGTTVVRIDGVAGSCVLTVSEGVSALSP